MEIILDMSEFENEINVLERIHYEIDARSRIINLMIDEGTTEHNETFNKYWEIFLEYIKAYNILKNSGVDLLSDEPYKVLFNEINWALKEMESLVNL